MSAIDDWLAGDDVDLSAALGDAAGRRELVELALVEVMLPAATAAAPRPAPPGQRARRVAAIAGLAVAVAMIVVLLLRPRPRISYTPPPAAAEHGTRFSAVLDDTTPALAPIDDTRVVGTPLGPVVLAPHTQATVRAWAVPAALYIEVTAGSATFAGQTLRAGERAAFGDMVARRRLGPRAVVRILALDARQLEASLPSGSSKRFKLSTAAEIAPGVKVGDRVELVLSPSETEVFYVRALP